MKEDIGIIAEVASMYYEQGYSQQEIAEKLYFSRSKVSRILTQAVDLGIVEIKVKYPSERLSYLEMVIKKMYPLNDVIVIKNYKTSHDTLLKRIGHVAAEYIETNFYDIEKIGLSWGETIYNMIESLKPNMQKHIHAVQLMGADDHDGNIAYDAAELIHRFIDKYNGTYTQLYSPLVVENDMIRQSLVKEPIIKKALKEAMDVDLVITSVGEISYGKNKAWEYYLNKNDYQMLEEKGAVGTLLAHFIKEDGTIVDENLDSKVIGIKLQDLKTISNVVVIAVGINKYKSLLGALNGGYVDTLIIDENLANALISSKK